MTHNYLKEYLDFYKQETLPGYAVLITGEWGSGKTYQVEQLLTKDEMYYISLFGINNQADIYASVFAKMYPMKGLAKDITQKINDTSVEAGGFTFGIAGLVGGIANAFIKETVNNDKIIVFDDLERCNIAPNEILGAINKYVDQHKCKVIAIAHDDKFSDIFHSTKEKVFGQTIQVESDADSVYDSFLEQTEHSEFLKNIKPIILRSFINSNSHSLRVLKHTINDCRRLYSCLNDNCKINSNVITEAFSLFSALSIEIRLGKIKEYELRDRGDTYRLKISSGILTKHTNPESDSNAPKDAIIALVEKNPEININSDLLSTEDLVNTLIKGYYNPDEINDTISKSRHFIPLAEQPAWMRFMNFDELEDTIVDSLIKTLDEEFKNRSLIIYGEMLHLFCLRFLMSYMGVIQDNYGKVNSECEKYIDELLNSNRLPEINNNKLDSYLMEDGYKGHGFWIRDEYSSYIKKLVIYLKGKMTVALKNKYPEYTSKILDAVRNDARELKKLICVSNDGAGEYYDIDVLSSIPVNDFVDAWLSGEHINWQIVSLSLHLRYNSGKLNTTLINEKIWFQKLKDELQLRADMLTGYQKYRVERLIMTANR